MTNVIDTLFDELYKGLNDKINKEESIEHYFLTMNDNEIKKLAYLISEELEEDINLEDKKENLVNYIIVNLDPLVKGILKYCDDSTFDKFIPPAAIIIKFLLTLFLSSTIADTSSGLNLSSCKPEIKSYFKALILSS